MDVAVQLIVAGGEHDSFVEFADALRADGALVERYNALKQSWDGRPMEEYRAAKAEFIEAVLKGR